jgi:hypothetical protein
MNAIMLDTSLMELQVQDLLWKENRSRQEQLLIPAAVSPQVTIKFSGSPIYSAAALSLEPRSGKSVHKCIFTVNLTGHHTSHLYISVVSLPLASALQEEAYRLLLAVKIAAELHGAGPQVF